MASDNEFRLVSAAISATEASKNDAQLRHELEKALEQECLTPPIAWTPFQLERVLKATGKRTKFADVPSFGDIHPHMVAISDLARSITAQRGNAGPGEMEVLKRHVHALLGI